MESLFNRQSGPRFQGIETTARRELTMLNNAQSLRDLRIPPGNLLEELHGDRQRQPFECMSVAGRF